MNYLYDYHIDKDDQSENVIPTEGLNIKKLSYFKRNHESWQLTRFCRVTTDRDFY